MASTAMHATYTCTKRKPRASRTLASAQDAGTKNDKSTDQQRYWIKAQSYEQLLNIRQPKATKVGSKGTVLWVRSR